MLLGSNYYNEEEVWIWRLECYAFKGMFVTVWFLFLKLIIVLLIGLILL